MDNFTLSYRISLADAHTEVFDFDLKKPATKQADVLSTSDLPFWTELSHRQCANCPLSTDTHTHCPLAVQLHDVVDRLHHTKSIDTVAVEVHSADRVVSQKTEIQRVIASMLELIYPTSGCPKTLWMMPLARFHTPLASDEETLFRSASMFLLAQHFAQQKNDTHTIGLHGLADIYNEMHTLNSALASRLQAATQSDSLKNAISLVDMYAILIPMLLEDNLAELASFFDSYFNLQAEDNPPNKAQTLDLSLEPLQSDNGDTITEKKPPKTPAAEDTTTKNEEDTAFVTRSGLSLELAPMEDLAKSG